MYRMKITNSIPDFPIHFLRRMAGWCAKQVGLPASKVRRAEFRNRQHRAYSGHAYGGGRIVVSVGPAHLFPLQPDTRPGMGGLAFQDRVEALVAVTTHEVAHLLQYREGRSRVLYAARRTEKDARWNEHRALLAFREAREQLMAAWMEPPKQREPEAKQSIQEQRAEKAAIKVAEWTRKLKLAQTKLRQYKRRQILAKYCDF